MKFFGIYKAEIATIRRGYQSKEAMQKYFKQSIY